jgi:hypothetical protein
VFDEGLIKFLYIWRSSFPNAISWRDYLSPISLYFLPRCRRFYIYSSWWFFWDFENCGWGSILFWKLLDIVDSNISLFLLFCLTVLSFELRVSCLLGRWSTIWATPPALSSPSDNSTYAYVTTFVTQFLDLVFPFFHSINMNLKINILNSKSETFMKKKNLLSFITKKIPKVYLRFILIPMLRFDKYIRLSCR